MLVSFTLMLRPWQQDEWYAVDSLPLVPSDRTSNWAKISVAAFYELFHNFEINIVSLVPNRRSFLKHLTQRVFADCKEETFV